MRAALRRALRCKMCASNKHGECDLHINDGAVDAEEFISVSCACPCEGEVQQGGKLIDLVAVLREDLSNWKRLYEASGRVATDHSNAHRALLRQIGEYLEEIFDDEGDGLQVSPHRNWLKTMRALQDRYVRTLAEYPLDARPDEPGEDDQEEDPLDYYPEDDVSPGVN